MNLPKLELPDFFKRPAGGEKPSGEKPKPAGPKFLSDLYRDLDDRHLLLPLIGLLVAIVAVPLLLSSSPEPTTPAAAPPSALADSSALDAAVIVANPGIRDYRERLAALREKNPFEAAAGGTVSSGNDGSTTSTTSGGDGSGASAATDSPASPSIGSDSSSSVSSGSTSTGSVSIDTGTDTSTDPTTTPTDTTDTDTDDESDTSPDDVKPETRFYASRIDVAVGPVGKTKTIEGIKQLDFLPDQKTPLVAYLGLVNDSTALFSVNPGVPETQGEGECAPRRNACMYLSLKVGEEQRFVYGDEDDATIYRLKLLEARTVRVPDPLGREDDEGKGQASADRPVDATSRSQ